MSLLTLAGAVQARPPRIIAARVPVQHVQRARPVGHYAVRAVRQPRARKVVVRREVRVRHEVVRHGAIRHEDIVRHVGVQAVPLTTVVTTARKKMPPHLEAALNALNEANQILQRPTVPGDLSALGALKTAHGELEASSANDAYHRKRYFAIEATKHAIHVLEGSKADANAQALTQEAAGDVQYCIQVDMQ
jgi:hypothetical protein